MGFNSAFKELTQCFRKWQVFLDVSKHRTAFTVSVKKFFDSLTMRMKTL